MDISDYAAQDVELFFGLNSDGVAGGVVSVQNIEFFCIPEPATLALLCMGAFGLLVYARGRPKGRLWGAIRRHRSR